VESHRLLGLLLLGAAHGVNPGMGWLFAFARGCQEGSRRSVWGSLGPLAIGHAVAIAVPLVLAGMLGAFLPLALLRSLVGIGLVVRGMTSIVRHRHPRGGGMRVGVGGLAWWSFLMASAHGAGLMALPLVLRGQAPADGDANVLPGAHVHHAGAQMSPGPALHVGAVEASAAHAVGYLVITALLAIVVYEYVGVRMLRSTWINMDIVWTGSLIITGGGDAIRVSRHVRFRARLRSENGKATHHSPCSHRGVRRTRGDRR